MSLIKSINDISQQFESAIYDAQSLRDVEGAQLTDAYLEAFCPISRDMREAYGISIEELRGMSHDAAQYFLGQRVSEAGGINYAFDVGPYIEDDLRELFEALRQQEDSVVAREQDIEAINKIFRDKSQNLTLEQRIDLARYVAQDFVTPVSGYFDNYHTIIHSLLRDFVLRPYCEFRDLFVAESAKCVLSEEAANKRQGILKEMNASIASIEKLAVSLDQDGPWQAFAKKSGIISKKGGAQI